MKYIPLDPPVMIARRPSRQRYVVFMLDVVEAAVEQGGEGGEDVANDILDLEPPSCSFS